MNPTSNITDKDKNLPMTVSSITSEAAVSPPAKDCVDVKQDAPPMSTASAIPDGGFVAWLQCAGSFSLFFNCWGIVNTFGVYQTFYEQVLLPNELSSDISWVGSIQAFLLVFGGVAAGPLYDYGYLLALVSTGSFLVVLVGLGSGCLFVPSIAILPTYFSTKRALAQGIPASGSSLGFGWAPRVIAFIMLATLIVPLASMKMRVKPSMQRRIFEPAAWREAPYTLFALGTFFGFMGLYIPFFYVQIYSIKENILGEDFAFYLLALLNGGSFFGRIGPNFIADKTGPFNTFIPCSLVAAPLAFIWLGSKTPAGIIIFCLLYGFFSGTFVSLSSTVTITLCPSMSLIGVRIGMLFVPTAIGLLIGNPIAGAILPHGWPALEVFCGVAVALATGFMVAARVKKYGCGLRVKT
ncbi:MAG: hypothetical protein M1830_002209 [Pleopsidium flavum]|nr:MAG: hypothetical protein M1830_002209 [Pleopsidium flavum]